MNNTVKTHTITLFDRKNLEITGVSELLAFDEESVVLSVCGSTLTVTGSGLTVSRLSLESGEIDVSGKVDSLFYEQEAQRGRSLVSRLLGRE